MRSKRAALAYTLSIVACVLTTVPMGCRTTTATQSVLPRATGNDPEQQLDYWHTVATQSLINNDDAFHGLLLYLDGRDDSTTYAQRVASLKSRGYLPQNFNQPADRALERGTVAVALAKSLDLKGGLTIRLAGMSPRYATRELEYKGVYPPSSPQQIFTGGEFVGVIGKAEDFRQGDPTNLPASQVGPATAQNTKMEDRGWKMAQDEPSAAAPFSILHPPSSSSPIYAMIAPEPADMALRPPTTTTSTQPAGAVKITVTAVEGLASVRENENAAWQPAKKGMELGESAEFRTGPRGTIQFTIPPDQTVTVDRLTTMKVLQVIQKGGKVTTDMGIKYGRTRYDLEGGGLEHQTTLRSPNSTLAVRGTKVSLFDQPPFAPQAVSLTGRAEFATQRRKPIAFGNRGQGKTIVNAESKTAGDVAFSESVVDPTLFGARTDSEQALLDTVISRGAFVTIDRDTGIKIVRGGIPPTDAQLIPALPGKLNFVLRWSGADANLDLGVSTPGTDGNPGGEFVYPAAGLNIAPSGGKTAFDHRGGPNGGIEVVFFDKFSDGIFALGGPNLTPNTTVTATLEAFLDGKPIDLFDGEKVTKQVVQTVTSSLPGLALVAVNTPSPFVNPPPPPTDNPPPSTGGNGIGNTAPGAAPQRATQATPLSIKRSRGFVGPLPVSPNASRKMNSR